MTEIPFRRDVVEGMTEGAKITMLGLAFHCIVDGFAFGVSGYSNVSR